MNRQVTYVIEEEELRSNAVKLIRSNRMYHRLAKRDAPPPPDQIVTDIDNKKIVERACEEISKPDIQTLISQIEQRKIYQPPKAMLERSSAWSWILSAFRRSHSK